MRWKMLMGRDEFCLKFVRPIRWCAGRMCGRVIREQKVSAEYKVYHYTGSTLSPLIRAVARESRLKPAGLGVETRFAKRTGDAGLSAKVRLHFGRSVWYGGGVLSPGVHNFSVQHPVPSRERRANRKFPRFYRRKFRGYGKLLRSHRYTRGEREVSPLWLSTEKHALVLGALAHGKPLSLVHFACFERYTFFFSSNFITTSFSLADPHYFFRRQTRRSFGLHCCTIRESGTAEVFFVSIPIYIFFTLRAFFEE